MYQCHYNYVLNTFTTFNDVKLLFTGTDSLVYEIKGSSVYEQCYKDKHSFDFRGYPKDSVYYFDINKKVGGKFKDDFNGVKISEFVGLKSKMYSLVSFDNNQVSKAKGVNIKLKHIEFYLIEKL